MTFWSLHNVSLYCTVLEYSQVQATLLNAFKKGKKVVKMEDFAREFDFSFDASRGEIVNQDEQVRASIWLFVGLHTCMYVCACEMKDKPKTKAKVNWEIHSHTFVPCGCGWPNQFVFVTPHHSRN